MIWSYPQIGELPRAVVELRQVADAMAMVAPVRTRRRYVVQDGRKPGRPITSSHPRAAYWRERARRIAASRRSA